MITLRSDRLNKIRFYPERLRTLAKEQEVVSSFVCVFDVREVEIVFRDMQKTRAPRYLVSELLRVSFAP